MCRCHGLLAKDGLRAVKALAEKLQQRAERQLHRGGRAAQPVAPHHHHRPGRGPSVGLAGDDGWLRVDQGAAYTGSGRSTVRYLINPMVLSMRATD